MLVSEKRTIKLGFAIGAAISNHKLCCCLFLQGEDEPADLSASTMALVEQVAATIERLSGKIESLQGKMGKIHSRLGRVEANPSIFNTSAGANDANKANIFDVDFAGGL